MSRIWHTFASGPRGCFTTVLGVFILLGLGYWGYCWGWWGRTNLVLQYLLQCRCPAASEEARYRPFAVLVSACRPIYYPPTNLSPDGRFLMVHEEAAPARIFRLDLVTKHQQTLPFPKPGTSAVYHIDDHRLVAVHRGVQYTILDMRDGALLSIPVVTMHTTNLDKALLPTLRRAAEVWVLPTATLVLAPNAQDQPDQNLVLDDASLQTQQHLTAAGIPYKHLPRPYTTGPVWDALYSRDGRFWADPQGIALAETDARIVPVNLPHSGPAAAFRPIGWTSDNRGVVYAPNAPGYLIGDLSDGGYWPHLFPLPQPILLVEVPEEYRE